MVFDWFRRKFDKSESESESPDTEQVETATSVVETAEAAITVEEVDPVSEEVATDYLAWAKAAYQNIQQQQESPAVVEPESATTSLDLIAAEIATTDSKSAEIQIETNLAEIEPDLPAAKTDPAIEDSEDPQSTAQSIPIWAQDDRQQRIEQLKASAIEPEQIDAPGADIDLDEDFLWSAKVLADQGRTPEQVSLDEINWLKKLRQGLDKTRRGFVNQFKALIGQGPLNANAVESIETLLLQAKLRQESLPPEEAVAYLKQILRDLLDKPYLENYTPEFLPIPNQLNIWLLVGVNGVGKTTTIGKLAHMTQSSGYKCLIAAADTFRAAAVEQVKVWGERSGIEVIANPGQNTDPAAVVYDAISAAQARGTELLLVDTAGRLQNKKNLMDELSKVRRIIDKQANGAQIESLLVLDATLGQNGLRQAQVFAEAAKLSGVVLTKLDGTAKGGVALAVVQQLGLPIRFIGAGEGIEDLRPFSSYEFVEALLSG
jgi:fused signal recognition particle receptor